MNYYKFNCGCSFPFLDEEKGLLDFDLDNLREDCPAVWQLLEKGLTVGIFQIETNAGSNWTQRLKPKSIGDLTALGAILRPGPLQSKESDGKSLTEHFCLRKNKEEEANCQFPALKKILEKTYYCLIYQEQVLKIGQEIAGLSLQEADEIRDVIAKKQSDKLPKVKEKFLNGCEKVNKVNKEEGEKIFEWIEAGQRYIFNQAHSRGYASTTYITAYMKAHFPFAFYLAKLQGAKHKIDYNTTVKSLINDAKLFNVEVELPDLRHLQKDFYLDSNKIRYGLTNIKGIGDSCFNKIALIGKINSSKFVSFCLTYGLPHIPDSSVIKLIQVGALSWLGLSRSQMESEYNVLLQLSTSERKLLLEKFGGGEYNDVIDLLEKANKLKKDGGIIHRSNRLSFLKSYIQILRDKKYKDNPIIFSYLEDNLLGTSISFQKIDCCDLNDVNTSCKDFINGKKGLMILGVDINLVHEKTIQKGNNVGKKMAILRVQDSSCELKAIAWNDIWEQYQNILIEKNSVIIEGTRSGKKSNHDLIIKRAWQAKTLN